LLDESINLSNLFYKGAFLCIKARDSFNLFKKKSYASQCLNIVNSIDADKYYKLNYSLYIRLLVSRGILNGFLPKSLNASANALSDLLIVLQDKKVLEKLNNTDKTSFYMALYRAYTFQDNVNLAIEYKNKAFSINKDLATKLLLE